MFRVKRHDSNQVNNKWDKVFSKVWPDRLGRSGACRARRINIWDGTRDGNSYSPFALQFLSRWGTVSTQLRRDSCGKVLRWLWSSWPFGHTGHKTAGWCRSSSSTRIGRRRCTCSRTPPAAWPAVAALGLPLWCISPVALAVGSQPAVHHSENISLSLWKILLLWFDD